MEEVKQKGGAAANPAQAEAFQCAARELGADESEGALDRVMGKLDLKKKPEATPPATEPQSSDRQR
jgi:hypothetical protein